jgi:aquaporin Z
MEFCHISKHIAHKRVASIKEPLLQERLLAEFVGTFFLVLTVGVSVAGKGPMAPVAIGLVLGVQIYTFGSVSGAFFNPAVVLAVSLSERGKISPIDAAAYAAVESLGAVLGGGIAYAVTGSTFCFDYSLTRAWGTSLVLETLFTMLLCSTVLATGTSNDAPNHYFGFAIGLTVTGGALAVGGFDQGSLNPAVTMGINFANYMNGNATLYPSIGSWVIFLLAPVLGGGLAAGVFRGTRSNEFESLEPSPQVTQV